MANRHQTGNRAGGWDALEIFGISLFRARLTSLSLVGAFVGRSGSSPSGPARRRRDVRPGQTLIFSRPVIGTI
jgi:hypothetical protein